MSLTFNSSTAVALILTLVIITNRFCQIQCLPSSLRRASINEILFNDNLDEGEEDPGIPGIRDFNCYDTEGIPYILDIPHPYLCHKFVKCSERYPGVPIGVEQDCPSNLFFSMETCNCEYERDAICFDSSNSTHEAERLKCACPLIKDETGNYVRDPDDDRCAH